MDESIINDSRTISDFKRKSFSGYKLSDVIKELRSAVLKSKIEEACYWSIELICSGHFEQLWEQIFFIMSNHVHASNPKLSIYINMRYKSFRKIIRGAVFNSELELRNNDEIRRLFAELIGMLTCSKKNRSFECIKVNANDFELQVLAEKFKAPNTDYVNEIFQENDPKEVFIPLNEFIHNLDTKDFLETCYWVEWLIEFSAAANKKKRPMVCERRKLVLNLVETNYQTNVIWLLWDIILRRTKEDISKKIIENLFELFCVRYKPTSNRKRKHVIFFAIQILSEHMDLSQEMCGNTDALKRIIDSVNKMYKQIKKNEVSPNTDYLFDGLHAKSDLKKTNEKLKIIYGD